VNRQTRQWGTEYDPSLDFGRVELRRRSLPETAQSLTISLEPNLSEGEGELPQGTLRIAWGDSEYSGQWQVTWPTDG
ncbi:MAG: DUF2911 domain-containing protein, partial [Vicinamibacterales bacterium]|nr:DUF2911 domain-containing protein [Vicinamibacterales bacterium]